MWSQSLCSHRLWSHRLLLASLTNPVPLVVSTTDRLSVSDMGTTARLLGHTTGRRFPAMSNTTGPTGRPQMMMANTTRHQVAPNTSHLTGRLSATGRPPARVERVRSDRPFGRWSEKPTNRHYSAFSCSLISRSAKSS